MVKGLFRCVLIVAVLIVIFGFGSKAFSATLADAYGVLIGNGWTVKDALGFLGTSIAGTLAMNPSLAPSAAAGALSAYIAVKGAQLYDIYQEWRNLRTGIAILNPVAFSQAMSVKQLKNGEYGWTYIEVYVRYYRDVYWDYKMWYTEYYNDNGTVKLGWGQGTSGSARKEQVIEYMNWWLRDIAPTWKDGEGRAIFTSLINTAYNYLLSNAAYSGSYSRQVVPALESGANSAIDSTLGYRINLDPQSISEDGVQYLNDPDAFYSWFMNNYMNGTNQGTFVTPSNEIYDEIRSQLETIINQLNTLSGGGVSEDMLNQLKTDIINTITNSLNTKVDGLNTKVDGVNTKVDGLNTKVDDVNTKVDGLNSSLTSVNSNLNSLQSDISDVQTSIDTLSTEIGETQEEQQGFWDGLMAWLNETLWTKLKELFTELFVPSQEQVEQLLDIQLPEYQKNFVADVAVSSQSTSIPISLFGASVDLSGYISQYASALRSFMNIFVSGLAAFFVIRAFRVHLNID